MSIPVRHVLFYVPLKPGNLMLCEMDDGKLRILKNDEPVDDGWWEAGDMAKAVAAYQAMKAGYLAGRSSDEAGTA